MFLLFAGFLVASVIVSHATSAVPVSNYSHYAVVFPPLDPSSIPKLEPNKSNYQVVTICELWENNTIPVTPAIQLALDRMQPHFAFQNIEFRIVRAAIPSGCGDSTTLASAPTLVDLHLQKSKTGCALLVGPSCTESMYNIRGLAMRWNIPVITSGASGIRFEDKRSTDVLTRFGYTQEDVSLFLIRILDHFSWSNHAVLSDHQEYSKDFQNSYQEVLRLSRVDLYVKLESMQFLSDNLTGSAEQLSFLEGLLIRAAEKARVIIIAALPRVVYNVLQTADRLGLMTPDFVYITTNLIETKRHGFSDLTFFDDITKSDMVRQILEGSARRLLDSLLVIRVKMAYDVTDGKEEYQDFFDSVKRVSRQSFGYTYPAGEEITHLVLGIWDGVMLYGAAMNKAISNGKGMKDGREITKLMWGHSFRGIVIDCAVSQYGDRNFPYFLLDRNSESGKFEPVVALESGEVQLRDLNEVHWPGETHQPPLNTPFCGFTGNNPVCIAKGLPVYGIAIIVAGCIFVILLIGVFVYQWLRKTTTAESSWKIARGDLFYKDNTEAGASGTLSDLVKDDRTTASTKNSRVNELTHMPTAVYKDCIVAVKLLEGPAFHITKNLDAELRSLKQLLNDHIARFHGLCNEEGSVCIVTEYCAKGSLSDLIEDDSVSIDWTFKFSLINDIISGLNFIHHSTFKSHGRITTNNCLVDSRFVVKIGDLGLAQLRSSVSVTNNCLKQPEHTTNPQIWSSLLWRAPEHLRATMPPNGTPKGDIFSFGIILQQLAERSGPYEHVLGSRGMQSDPKSIVERVRQLQSPPFRPAVPIDLMPPELYTIMLRCWSEDPVSRYDVDRLRNALRKVPGNSSNNLVDDLLRRMERYARDLEALVTERTAAFMDEKKRSEELLYQMLPRPVADKLKEGLFVAPEAFESVTIYFSDIVGFTTLSAASTPMEIVDLLNDLYTVFDGIIEAYDVYKVETIGDAYLVVSGLPQRNGVRHAVEIGRMSTHVMRSMQAFKIRHRPGEKLAVRVGVHSGSCAAGVVGLKMPRYCLFGDSVNIASRLESTSQAMKIQISATSKALLDGNKEFITEHRGEVDLKGRGRLDTYWLLPPEND